ncbi:putative disease resistance protein RGA3 isoform X1 [Oryza glaberrima]|nr:putative disease resistance protein RGA3 isoform X1 [Oryza glaberrima]
MLQSAIPMCSCLTNQDTTLHDISKMELEKILNKIENNINEALKILALLPSYSKDKERQTVAVNSRIEVTTAAPPPVVIGRDMDHDKIIGMLHEKVDYGQRKIRSGALCYSVIGIHGIPGSGKSTLAQLVCASERKKRHFKPIMWVHVSKHFSVDTILSEMLEAATGNPCPEFKNRDTLQQKLEEALTGERFLLVLDDVWCEKNSGQLELQKIVSPLKVGGSGSKILATSRTADALLALDAMRCIPIADMDDDVFLQLFMHYALEGADIDERDRAILKEIGSGIAKKLRRSPLAASIVGRQLRMRLDADFWRDASKRDLLKETMGALLWSYQQLDEQVRRCFAYCSIFPRRYRLKRDELINLWVAEGFIGSTDAGEEMEDVGGKYLDELVSASFLQQAGQQRAVSGAVDYFIVHDLLHDLAERVNRSDCFRIENGWTGVLPPNVRHLFVETYNKAMISDKILEMESLRTLIIYRHKQDIPFDKFMRLKKLRVLSMLSVTTSNVFSFPASIGRLKHLRYLAFRTGRVKLVFPSTFTNLYHLQVLDIGGCKDLVFSSGEDINLLNLRHVISSADLNFRNIGSLTSLQTLSFFTAKKGPGYELRQLKHLSKLRGRLEMHGLENVQSKEEALEANLASKEHLKKLALVWDKDTCCPEVQAEVLEGLYPPPELEKLEITNYHGSRYPDWMVGKQKGPKNLHILSLSSCSGLGSSQKLSEFVNLRSLGLYMCSWNALPDNMEQLTSLQTLVIYKCQNICSLPMLPRSLVQFVLRGCNPEFRRSCETIGDPNWQKIQHIANKEFDSNQVDVPKTETAWKVHLYTPLLPRFPICICRMLRLSLRVVLTMFTPYLGSLQSLQLNQMSPAPPNSPDSPHRGR